MPVFSYEAIDASGNRHRGMAQADTARDARGRLRERGLVALVMRPASGPSSGQVARIRAPARAVLTRQLATLVKAGLPLEEALSAVTEGAEESTRVLMTTVRGRILEGATMADALRAFPDTFDPLFVSTVAAGEQSGQLASALLRLADYLEGRERIRRQVVGALVYPAVLFLVAVAVVTGLTGYVVPEVAAVFVRSGQALPLPTRILIATSSLIRSLGPFGLLAAGACTAVAWRRWSSPGFASWRHRQAIGLPWIGRWVVAAQMARFSRTLALLGLSSVPLLDGLRLSAEAVTNSVLRSSLFRVREQVRAGAPLSSALAQEKRFPATAVRLLANGERAGQLEAMLDEAASQLERDLSFAVSVLVAVLAPAVVIVVGSMVLFIVLAILLPIFEMNQLVR